MPVSIACIKRRRACQGPEQGSPKPRTQNWWCIRGIQTYPKGSLVTSESNSFPYTSNLVEIGL
jgi:hypothetical protein